MSSVSLVRRTRTARDEKLFHHEFVPERTSFRVRISGQNLSDADVALLRWVLARFNTQDRQGNGLQLGKNTSNGWGHFDWEPGTVHRLDRDAAIAWIKGPQHPVGWAALPPLPTANLAAIDTKVATLSPSAQPDRITLPVTLHFDGALIVREGGPKPASGDKQPITARITPEGKVLLPARSFRGALRSQAERILRTLAPDADAASRWAPDPTAKGAAEFAPTEPNESDPELSTRLAQLPLASRVFGIGGWKSAVEVSDFVSSTPVNWLTQDCVAIDRFTGGAAEGALFSFKVAWQPVLFGTITLHIDRWNAAGVAEWAPGLIALVLRDLRDGDITFGLGAAKGYGACHAGFEPATAAWFAHAAKLAKPLDQLIST